MIKLIVYDLDGTLIDSRLDIASSANHTLRQLGLRILSVDEVSRSVGIGVQHLMREIIRISAGLEKANDERLVKEAVSIFRAYYDEHLLDQTRLYPSVKTTLSFFHGKGMKQAVLTNKSEGFSRKILAGLEVENYFFALIGGDSAFPKKPEPDSLFHLMRLADAKPAESIFVGDSVIDVETGKHADVKTIIIPHGFQNREEIEQFGPATFLEGFEKLAEFLSL